MRKAQPKEEAEVFVSDADLQTILPFLDKNARIRSNIERTVRDLESSLRTSTITIRNAEATIESNKRVTVRLERDLETHKKKLSETPEAEGGIEELKEELAAATRLPWVSSLHVSTTNLYITTRTGVLKTDFYERVAYRNGSRTTELLPEPLSLPLPTYEIIINLGNMGNSWAVNANLQVRLAVKTESQFFAANDSGWSHQVQAHWASNERSASYDWAPLCLGDYDAVLMEASKRGIVELLSELAVFLQTSGWSSAYRPRLTWAAIMGNPVYNQHLLRKLVGDEQVEQVQAKHREEVPDWLKKHGVSMSQFTYGSGIDT